MKESVCTGTQIVRTVANVFTYLCFGTKSFSLSNTERRLDECKPEQFEGSRHKGRSGWKVLIIQTDVTWVVKHPDGISRRLDECKGSNFFDLKSMQNFLEAFL